MAKRPAKAEQKNGTALTEYVVLRQAQVREEPVEQNPVTETAWLLVDELIGEGTPDAYWQPKLFRAPSKHAAIRQHTGDGAEVIEGSWRAVPLSSWRGGETTRRVAASERLPLDA